MAAKSVEECNMNLAQFLGENALRKLQKKHKDNFSSKQYLRDLYDIICDHFPSDFDQENEVFLWKGVDTGCHFSLSELVLQICTLFTSHIVLQTSAEYLKELEKAGKQSQFCKICKILTEIVRSCSFHWFVGVHTQEPDTLETSDLEKPKKGIVEFIMSLLNLINLLPFNAEELRKNPRINLFPRILELCKLILGKFSENSKKDEFRNFRLSIVKKLSCDLVMTCIQQVGNNHWVSDYCKEMSMGILKFLVVECGCCDVAELLSGFDTKLSKDGCLFPSGLLGSILESLKKFMVKNKLPDSPVAIHILVWSMRRVKHPFLGAHISMILPPLLLLVDNYRVANRVTGIQTLTHVIENMNATELCWYGRADMIYHALHHRIHTNEPEVMLVLQPCLLKVIKVIEPSSKNTVASHTKCDENFQIILTAMEFENKILMRRVYCSHLVSFIDHMGVTVVRHFKCLLRVIFGYLGIGDGETESWRLVMLDVLNCAIANAWSRVPNHADDILRCLMKLIIDVSMSSIAPADVKCSMFEKIEKCLLLLLCVCGEPVKVQLECMTTGLGLSEAEELITRTLASYKSNSL